jgi:uncharacterized protein YjbI with pentapeptide repeats
MTLLTARPHRIVRYQHLMILLLTMLLGACGPRIRPGADLHDKDLHGKDLSGRDLSGADLSSADLEDTNLSDANLSDADLHSADLSGANLRGANLSGANLDHARLTDADLTGADLSGADITEASTWNATLDGATFTGVTGLTYGIIANAASSDWDDLAVLAQVCEGQGVPQAAAYDGKTGPHSVVLISLLSKTLHDWNFDLPEQWQTNALDSVDLVGCIDLESVVLGSCQYEAVDDGGILTEFTMDRVQYKLTVTLVEARTGVTVDSTTLSGSLPESCPASLDMFTGEQYATMASGGKVLSGSEVSFPEVKVWLADFVGP